VRTIVHLSDLHFGRHDPGLVRPLLDKVAELSPALVAVSGDLTQRARPAEFAAARAFLDAMPFPKVVVPGNHDVPMFEVIDRFARPLQRYERFIGDPTFPSFHDAELAVIGINTARSFAIQNGRISYEQMHEVDVRLAQVENGALRVLVTHHPFIPPPAALHLPKVGRAAKALHELEESGVHLLLAGHLHRAFTADVLGHYPALKRSILVMQAGTALSTRLRGERNAFNVVTVEPPGLSCTTYLYDGAHFVEGTHVDYELEGHRWKMLS
jgi:3',5'-cyclic AMP phosphodiesterase CpdA